MKQEAPTSKQIGVGGGSSPIRMAMRKQDMPEMGMQGLPCYPGTADKQERVAHNETLLEFIQAAKPQML